MPADLLSGIIQSRKRKLDFENKSLTSSLNKRSRRYQICNNQRIVEPECEGLNESIQEDTSERVLESSHPYSRKTNPNQPNVFEELVCSICGKNFHEQKNLALHEKIPHFWSCTHRGCNMAFETKTDRTEHEGKSHTTEEHGGESNQRDHLVMNSDGTMSFNHLTSSTTKRPYHSYQQQVDLSKLAKNSDYGGSRVKNGFVNRVNYQTRAKNEKWNKEETSKFYKNLSIYGSNFALLAALFKGRSRKQLKNKYKKEERENPKLIKDALTNRKPMELNMDEFEEIVTENMRAKQTLAQKTDNNDVMKRKGLRAKTVRELSRVSRKRNQVKKLAVHETAPNDVVDSGVGSIDRQLKRESVGKSLLELGPPPGAEKDQDDDSLASDYEFDPFA